MISSLPQSFWGNFWPSFTANLLAGIILAFVITYFITIIKRPRLEVGLKIGTSTQRHRYLSFFCINNGKTGLMPDQVQFEIYFENCFVLKNDIPYMGTIFDGKPVLMFSGTNKLSCFPGSSCLLLELPTVLSKSFPYNEVTDAPFYYTLTTIDGQKHNWKIFNRFFKKYLIESNFIKKRLYKIKKIDI